MSKKRRVLWLDDNIGKYNFIVDLFSDSKIEIVPASTYDEGIAKLDDTYDAFIVDLKLGPGEKHDGVDFIFRIFEKRPNAIVVVLSAHLHEEDFRNRIERIEHPAGILEKDFEGELKEIKKRFLKRIDYWIDKKPELRPSRYYKLATDASKLDPFKMGYEKFSTLPEYVHDMLADRVRGEMSSIIQRNSRKGLFG